MAAQPSFSGGLHHTVHFSAVMPVKRIGPSTGPGVSARKKLIEETCYGKKHLYHLCQQKRICLKQCFLTDIITNCPHLQTLDSNVNISFLGSRAIFGLYSVNSTVVPVRIANKQTTGANASINLNVNHSPLVDLFTILVPKNLWDWTSGDFAAETDIISSPQGEHLVWRPLNLRSNWRCRQKDYESASSKM